MSKEHLVVTVEDEDPGPRRPCLRRMLKFMGPGLLMSIAFVDPGNLESDLQTGVTTAYDLLWVLLVTTMLGFVVQMQAAKLGVVTGKHLAEHCREQYKIIPRLSLWIMAEVAIIGSDIQEVIGSAIAIQLLSAGRIPLWGGVLITALDSFALLYVEKIGIRFLELFFGLLISIMVASFGIMFFKAEVPVDEVLRGFLVPALPQKDIPTAVALFGSLIMPHNIYLHSALVQSRKIFTTTKYAKQEALVYFSIESALSLMAAVFINLFVVAVFAAGFSGQEVVPEIGLQNAGLYLGKTYGPAMVVIWALGLLAAGQSSTMTGTYTGQFVMAGYLDLKISPVARVTLTRTFAIIPAMVVSLCFQSTGTELDVLNQGLNLLQSVQLPFALVPLISFTSSTAIMGDFAASWFLTTTLWVITAVVVGINASAAHQVVSSSMSGPHWLEAFAIGFCILYISFVVYLVMARPSHQLVTADTDDDSLQAPLLNGHSKEPEHGEGHEELKKEYRREHEKEHEREHVKEYEKGSAHVEEHEEEVTHREED